MARRSKGEGTYRTIERKNGNVVEYRVTIDGKRKTFTAQTKQKALRKYRTYLEQQDKIELKDISVTVAEWADRWFTAYKSNEFISFGSKKNYEGYIKNHIKPSVLGLLRVKDVKPVDIHLFYSDKQYLSKSALNYLKIIICNLFDSAIDNGLCVTDPTRKLKHPTKDEVKVESFSEIEIAKILKCVNKSIKALYNFESSDFGYVIFILLHTGMRSGELLALDWQNIDLSNDLIHVKHSVGRCEGQYEIGPTKNRKERDIAIVPELKKLLSFLRNNSKSKYVIPGQRDFMRPPTFLRNYKKFFTDNNLKYRSPHKCRHTLATNLLNNGANIRAVQDTLGHLKVTTTQKYTHVDNDKLKENIGKLNYKKTP